MTQYEGIRTASDIELHEAYRRLVLQGNSESAPVRIASRHWLNCLCNEINRRYPSPDGGYWLNDCYVSNGDPGDEIEA